MTIRLDPVLPAGNHALTVSEDIASNFARDETSREKILLDGESYRTVLSLRRGIGSDLELGLELPFVGHGGGIFDDFIVGWHDTFNLPQGGRKSAPKGRLLYRYEKDGTVRLLLDESGYGLGDIRLTGGWQLYREATGTARHAIALRGSLKFPTGSAAWLRGSGSTDVALWLSGSSTFTSFEFGGRRSVRSWCASATRIPSLWRRSRSWARGRMSSRCSRA